MSALDTRDLQSILLFDRNHLSAPTCTRLVPARAVAVKDRPRLRATASAARSVLDGREHDGMLNRVGAGPASHQNKSVLMLTRLCAHCRPPPKACLNVRYRGVRYPAACAIHSSTTLQPLIGLIKFCKS